MIRLVCVAPDGSLEVWNTYSSPSFKWCVHSLESITFYYGKRDPEFYGREVLGEL